ncbi:unnamed protein product [Gordionus sp. m RMFG-2023]
MNYLTANFAFAPRIKDVAVELYLRPEFYGQLCIEVRWSIEHLRKKEIFKNFVRFLIKLLPTHPDMSIHTQEDLIYDQKATVFKFANVTPHLEYRISVALEFKDENKWISLEPHVTDRVFIIVP